MNALQREYAIASHKLDEAYLERHKMIALRIDEIRAVAGSWRAAGVFVGIDHAYLRRLVSGEKINPSPEVLRALGLIPKAGRAA